MDLEVTKSNNSNKNFRNVCNFCGKVLKLIGLDYLYVNMSPELIEYERCNCSKAKEYWDRIDFLLQEKEKKEHYKEIIEQFYSQGYLYKRLKEYNFKSFKVTNINQLQVKIIKDYAKKCIIEKQENGLIITGDTTNGKTHLAGAIANELVKKDKLVLMGRLTSLLDMVKETFRDNSKSEIRTY